MRTEELAKIVTPIWDRERGRRLRTARMRLMLDQRLGLTQRTVSMLETGIMRTPRRPFTVIDLYDALDRDVELFRYVMFNQGQLDSGVIALEFWNKKLEPNRKRRKVKD